MGTRWPAVLDGQPAMVKAVCIRPKGSMTIPQSSAGLLTMPHIKHKVRGSCCHPLQSEILCHVQKRPGAWRVFSSALVFGYKGTSFRRNQSLVQPGCLGPFPPKPKCRLTLFQNDIRHSGALQPPDPPGRSSSKRRRSSSARAMNLRRS